MSPFLCAIIFLIWFETERHMSIKCRYDYSGYEFHNLEAQTLNSRDQTNILR